MAAAAVVIILVAAAEAQSPAISAAVGTASEALGPTVAVDMRLVAVPSDAEGLRLQRVLNAAALGTLTWRGGSRDTVIVRVHTAGSQGWLEQTVTFGATDPMPERGRALGLTLAAMMSPAIDVVVGERSRPPPRAPGTAPSTALEQDPPRGTWSLDVRGLGVRGIGGSAAGWGGAVGLERAATNTWRLRADGGFRNGEIPGLDGRHGVFHLGGGVAFRPWDDVGDHRLGWGLRLEIAALLHDFIHLTADNTSVHRYRVLPASIAATEITWRVAARVELVAGGGAELAFGKTEVVVASIPVATVPMVRVQADLGVRLGF